MDQAGSRVMQDGPAAPGRMIKVTPPEYAGTGVYHALYLPVDWRPDGNYPVIVEYAGNKFDEVCTGKVEDCRLGFYLSGGRGCLWIVLPFVNEIEKCNERIWWGDVEATVDYCCLNVRRACEAYGGDASRIVLAGFSRGAIACGFIGLHDDAVAQMWAGFFADAHFDGVQFTEAGAAERLARLRRRPVCIANGENDADGKRNSLAAAELLRQNGARPTLIEIAGTAHTDLWIEKDCEERRTARKWLKAVLQI